jgi:hypothetical protein
MSQPSWWKIVKRRLEWLQPRRRPARRHLKRRSRLGFEALEHRAIPAATAYLVPAGTVGAQAFTGSLGLDFDVNQPLLITRLGVFDSGSDGLSRALTVRIYDRATQAEVTSLTFAPGDTGSLEGGSRFLSLPVPLFLEAGFQGSAVAEGYGPGEENGNGLFQPVTWTTDDSGGVLNFVGGGRFSFVPGVFPTMPDSGPANKYAAGTFDYLALANLVSGPAGATAGAA